VSFDEGAPLIFRGAPVVSRRTHMPYIGAPALRDHCPASAAFRTGIVFSLEPAPPRNTSFSSNRALRVFELMRTAQGDEPDDRLRHNLAVDARIGEGPESTNSITSHRPADWVFTLGLTAPPILILAY